jgi:hypothetical protein
MMSPEEALEEWRDWYEISDAQVELMKSLYARKIANPSEPIVLSKAEIDAAIDFEHEDCKMMLDPSLGDGRFHCERAFGTLGKG